jgi:hypothetical protein
MQSNHINATSAPDFSSSRARRPSHGSRQDSQGDAVPPRGRSRRDRQAVQPDHRGMDRLLRVQRMRAIDEDGGFDDVIVSVHKLVTTSGWKSRPGNRQGAW